jgi:hypothetical protein
MIANYYGVPLQSQANEYLIEDLLYLADYYRSKQSLPETKPQEQPSSKPGRIMDPFYRQYEEIDKLCKENNAKNNYQKESSETTQS